MESSTGDTARAMSEENVEIVRRIFDAFNERDWEAWKSHHHPDVEWANPPEFPEAGVYHGVEAVLHLLQNLLEAVDEWQVQIDEARSVGPDRVLMGGRNVGFGHASGISLEDPFFQLFDFDEGRVSRVQTFRSRNKALEAAGLSE